MAAQGYIGRAPGESSVVVARQTFTPTGITTNFTFASGYAVGYVDAYLNGARLIEGDDYTATDGSVVGLTTHAISGDVLELVVYKAFNIGDVTGALNDFSVSNDLTVGGAATVTGAITATGGVVGNVTGDATGLSGTPDLTIRNLTGVAATFTGVLTYDDVTNVDAVGYSTFREGINVQGAGSTTTTLNVTGVTTMTGDANFSGNVSIAHSIFHTGDSNTHFGFPANDTFTVYTAGSERLEVDSTGTFTLDGDYAYFASSSGSTASLTLKKSDSGGDSIDYLQLRDSSNALKLKVSGDGIIFTSDILASHEGDTDTLLRFPAADTFTVETAGSERVRINSSGNVGIGTDDPPAKLSVDGSVIFGNTTSSGSGGTLRIIESGNSVYIQPGSNTSNDSSCDLIISSINGVTEKLRIDSSGRLLIGGTSAVNTNAHATLQLIEADGPQFIFARNDTSTGTNEDIGLIRFYGNDSDGNYDECARIAVEAEAAHASDSKPTYMRFFTTATSAESPTERLRITSAGDMGLGTATPTSFGPTFQIAGTDPALLLQDTATAVDYYGMNIGNGHVTTWFDDSAYFAIGTASGISGGAYAEKLRIESTGKTLINWGAVSGGRFGRLTIFDGDDFSTASQPGINDNIYLSSDATSGDNVYGASIAFSRVQYQDRRAAAIAAVQTTSDEDQVGLAFFTHASTDAAAAMQESVRIEHNGYMLIGTTTATGNTDRLLQVGDTSLSSAYIEVRTSTSGASGVVFSDNDDGSGTTGYRGTIEYIHSSDQLQFKTAGSTRLTCNSSGDFTATGNVTAYSDVTLKENIETIPNALDKVLNLRGVEFDRNDKENNPHEIGVIAQEVEEVVPEVVMTNEEGLKSVAYGNLVGLLIESIKELKAEVNDLKAQLEG